MYYYIYIDRSSDEIAYLPYLESTEVFDLHYFTLEKDFSNDLYTYAALQLYERAAENGSSEKVLQELRRCIQEGVCRPDYLLPASVLKSHIQDRCTDLHRRNYWRVMHAISRLFRNLKSQ